MKKTYLSLIPVLTLAVLLAGCGIPSLTSGASPIRTVSVNGVGRVNIEPDLARVNIGVRSESEDVTTALDDNSDLANAIRQTLTDLGIADEDIQTSNFNIYPQQKNQPMEMEGEGSPQTLFVVENTVSVIVRELDSLGEVLAAVVEEGANTIYGVTFDISDPQAAYADARQLAIKDAKDQAEAIVEVAGVKLGGIHTISVSDSGSPTPKSMMAMDQGMGGGSVPISSGTLAIQVTAAITYEIN